ncbi:hypothetical protein [Paractinoplanes globisporus]|uniref:Holin n=1 Tax=Paractinoplanes globisporus TaxID=113565 RepID=A0ABW6WWG6_9ACTN|nr:hypothetical protein [Actinoplanes globisporus]
MSDVETWSLVVGFLSATFVIPVLQQPRWPTRRRAWLTFAYAVLVGGAASWYFGELDFTTLDGPRSLVAAILTVFVSAIATYKGFAKETNIAPLIEKATSAGKLADETKGEVAT